jgi:hypothetical protein
MKRLPGRIPALALATFLATAGTAPALTLIDGGTMDFQYAQFPSGTYVGSFSADGELLTGVPAGGGTTALLFDSGGEHYLVVAAALLDGGGNVDAAVVMIRSASPFVPGVYPVDAINHTCTFAFVDDAVSFALPADPATADWESWFNGLLASRRFVGATGAVTLTEVGPSAVTGTFSGLSFEYGTNMPLSISPGAFHVTGALAVEDDTWAGVKADYRD